MVLCFGIIGRVLRACKLDGVPDVRLIGEITKTIDPNCEYGDSEGTAVSRLLSCEQNLSNGNARRKGQKTGKNSDYENGYLTNRLSDVIEEAKKADHETVAQNITNNVLPLIDEDKKELIAPALFDIIMSDESIDNRHSKSFEKHVGEEKKYLLMQRYLDLADLLAGLLIYTITTVKNREGKNCAHLVTTEYVDSFREHARAFHLDNLSVELYKYGDENSQPLGKSIVKYLEKVSLKYEKIYTLINKYEPVSFKEIFICNDIERRIVSSDFCDNTAQYQFLRETNAQELASLSRFVIITGTGGIGKSMMMRHLLFDAIDHYPDTGILPIFIMLKDFEDNVDSLSEYICHSVSNYGTGLTEERINALLHAGRCLLLFDGLDEIGSGVRERFGRMLEEFIDRYSNNQYILSSRPNRSFSPYYRFTPLFIRPFTKEQALALIDKINFRPDDPGIKRRFRDDLDNRLFRTHKEFAENPLLLTIMLMTYEKYEEVPSKMHSFYKKAFEALAQEHDANKGYKRPLATELSADDFVEYLAEFCALTYCDEKFELSREDIFHYFNKLNTLKRRSDPKATPANFIADLCNNLCILYLQNDKYHFTHRSFQEYFCAVCFAKQKDRDLPAIGDIFENMRSRNYADKTFPMLYDMSSAKIDEYMFIPFLDKLFSNCSEDNGYRDFLSLMYPFIEYEVGETDGYAETAPVSYIYEFIRDKYFQTDYDFSSLPKEDAFISERYCYILDPETNELFLSNVNDIPEYYEDCYGYPEEVGWILNVDTAKVFARNYHYKELVAALEDDDFCLKREYEDAKLCLNKLLDNQEPKGHSILERLI